MRMKRSSVENNWLLAEVFRICLWYYARSFRLTHSFAYLCQPALSATGQSCIPSDGEAAQAVD
jgi:hypothetical protein